MFRRAQNLLLREKDRENHKLKKLRNHMLYQHNHNIHNNLQTNQLEGQTSPMEKELLNSQHRFWRVEPLLQSLNPK